MGRPTSVSISLDDDLLPEIAPAAVGVPGRKLQAPRRAVRG